jgi:hypothetical protein
MALHATAAGYHGTVHLQVIQIPVSAIVVQPEWLRASGENSDHVQSLTDARDILPPIVVHRATMQVIDGLHRLRAAVVRGQSEIDAVLFDGDEDEAFLLAIRLNAAHGLPLSRADRNAAAGRILNSHPEWSDRKIASVAGLSDKTVAAMRRSSVKIPRQASRVGRDGIARPIDAAVGRIRASNLIMQMPHGSLRDIAGKAGVSLATARDVRDKLLHGRDPVQRCQRQERVLPRPLSTLPDGGSPVDQAGLVLLPDPKSRQLLDSLCRNPSMRYSETGRTILRLLSAQSITPEQWDRLIDSVPTHCAHGVAQLARHCAGIFLQFAQGLDESLMQRKSDGA